MFVKAHPKGLNSEFYINTRYFKKMWRIYGSNECGVEDDNNQMLIIDVETFEKILREEGEQYL